MIQLSTKDFRSAVQIASAAMDKGKRNNIPVLSAIKARANGRLELEATDLDMTAHVAIPCEAKGSSEFLLSHARGVAAAVGAAGGKTMTLEPFENGFVTTAGKLHRKAEHGMAPEDFPADVALIAETTFSATISAETLRQIERVVPAISTEETRYYLNGVNVMRLDGWTYRFAATDGHRLIVVDVQLPDAEGTLPESFIIPRRWLNAVFAHMPKADGPLNLRVGPSVARNSQDTTAPVRSGLARVSLSGAVGNAEVRFATKTIDGTYPDYHRVIPREVPYSALVGVTALRQAIQAVVAGAAVKTLAISLTFNKTGFVVAMAHGVEGVTSEFQVDCQHSAPKDFRVGFNADYLLDILNVVRGDEATFGLSDHTAPTTIRDTSDTTFLAVLMPMRV